MVCNLELIPVLPMLHLGINPCPNVLAVCTLFLGMILGKAVTNVTIAQYISKASIVSVSFPNTSQSPEHDKCFILLPRNIPPQKKPREEKILGAIFIQFDAISYITIIAVNSASETTLPSTRLSPLKTKTLPRSLIFSTCIIS